MMDLPKALIIDLDDTILDSDGNAHDVWNQVCQEFVPRLGNVSAKHLHTAVMDARGWLWGDLERARRWRLDLPQARRDLLTRALTHLSILDAAVLDEMSDRYSYLRDEKLRPFPGAIDALQRMRDTGVRMALLTNGSSESQRDKVD